MTQHELENFLVEIKHSFKIQVSDFGLELEGVYYLPEEKEVGISLIEPISNWANVMLFDPEEVYSFKDSLEGWAYNALEEARDSFWEGEPVG